MPDDEVNPNEGSTDTPAVQESTQTPKINVPGVGELSPEEIKAGAEALKNQHDWRSELNEKGREINETKRALEAQAEDFNRKIADIEATRTTTPIQPVTDWRTISDLSERQIAFEQAVLTETESVKKENKNLKQQIEAKELKDRQKEIYDYFNNITQEVMEEYGTGDSKTDMLIEGYISRTITGTKRDPKTWTADDFTKAAKDGRAIVDEIKKAKDTDYAGKKKEVASDKVVPTGKAPAPVAVKLTAGMSKADRVKLIMKDPNFQKLVGD